MESKMLAATSAQEKVTPKELIWRHIIDPTHVITEEEFSKLVVGLNPEDKKHQQN